MNIMKNILLVVGVLGLAISLGAASAAKGKNVDNNKKSEKPESEVPVVTPTSASYPKNILIAIPEDASDKLYDNQTKKISLNFKVIDHVEELRILREEKELTKDPKSTEKNISDKRLYTLNRINIERNYLGCWGWSAIAPCIGSLNLSAHTFMDILGSKDKQDISAQPQIFIDGSLLNLDLLYTTQSVWLGFGGSVGTSTISNEKVIVFKGGIVLQSENLRAEFGIMHLSDVYFEKDNTGVYFGIGVPIIGYATALKEKLASKGL